MSRNRQYEVKILKFSSTLDFKKPCHNERNFYETFIFSS